MLTLPFELRSWEPYLQFLDSRLIAPMAQLAGVLARTLGLSPRPRRNPEEPAGWGGLVNRGPLERMLASEWALADMMPDEFLRRAAQGELLYWQPTREGGAQSSTVRVLLDAGPDQLGACRVVQLALLIVLARQAQEIGCELVWAVSQALDKDVTVWHTQLSPGTVEAFLQARSAQPMSQDAVELLLVEAGPDDDLWLVGAEGEVVAPARVSRVVLAQEDPHTVRLRSPRAEAELTLPGGPFATRLLRNPLPQQTLERRSLTRQQPGRDVRFCLSGRKLLARSDNDLLVYPIPNSPREAPGRPRRFPLRYRSPLLALGLVARALVAVQAVVARGGERVWRAYRLVVADARFPVEIEWAAPEDFLGDPFEVAPGSCWQHVNVAWVQVGNQLWRSTLENGKYSPLRPYARTRAFLPGAANPLVLVGPELRLLSSAKPTGEEALLSLSESFPSLSDEHTILLSHGMARPIPAVALQQAPDAWTIVWHKALRHAPTLHHLRGVPPGEILGVLPLHPDRPPASPALVIRQERQVIFYGESGSTSLPFPDPLEEAVLCPVNHLLAYRTAAGEIGVYSHNYGQFLLKVCP